MADGDKFEDKCQLCDEKVMEMRVDGATTWMHVDPLLSPGNQRKYAWKFCKLTVAIPTPA